MSFGTRQPDVSHLTRLTCPLAPAGLFLPECLLFFTIAAAVLALRLMRLRVLPSSALPWRSASPGLRKGEAAAGGDALLGEDFRVQIPHRPRLFQSPPPPKAWRLHARKPGPQDQKSTRAGPGIPFFFWFPAGGGGQRCIERAPGTDQSTQLRRHHGRREDQVRRRRERRARERESVLRRRGIGREVGCGHAGAATLVRVPVTPETSREQPAPAWPRHGRVWRAAFLVPFGRRLRQ